MIQGYYCVPVGVGEIYKNDNLEKPLYTFAGPCGGQFTLTDCATNKTEKLINFETEKAQKIHWPVEAARDERNSLRSEFITIFVEFS
jgi:hypothetical protein